MKPIAAEIQFENPRMHVFLLAAACLLLLAQTLTLFDTRWVADESWYSSPAVSLVTEGRLRSQIFSENTLQGSIQTISPAHMVLLAGVFKVFGVSLDTARMVQVMFGLLGILLTYRIGRELGGPALGSLGALFLAADNMYFTAARTARPDEEAIAVALAGVLAYLVARRKSSAALGFLSGLLVGLASQMHPNAFSAAISIGFLEMFESRWRILRSSRAWLFVAGVLISVIPLFAWVMSDAAHREAFFGNLATGEYHTLSEIPRLELQRYKDFLGIPNLRFRFPVPLPFRLHVVVGLLAAAYFVRRHNHELFRTLLCLILPGMAWWAYIRNPSVRYTANAAPYFGLLLAGAALALWQWRPSWRRMVMAAAVALLALQVASNYVLLYLYRKADYTALTRQFHAVIPPDATVYGALPFWMAFAHQPFYSYNRTPLDYALAHGATYLILNDKLMLEGNGWGEDDWVKVRETATEFVKTNATLVGRAPNPYYGDLEIYRVIRKPGS